MTALRKAATTLGLLVSLSFVGCGGNTTPPSDDQSGPGQLNQQDASGVVSIADIEAAIQENTEAAVGRWRDKDITLSGYYLSALDSGGYKIHLGADPEESEASQYVVECSIAKDEVSKLDKGTAVVVSGHVNAMTTDAMYVLNCHLLSADNGMSAPDEGTPFDPTAGPVFAVYGLGASWSLSIVQVDVTTGKQTAVFDNVYSYAWNGKNDNYKTIFGQLNYFYSSEAWVNKQVFDASLERMAVMLTDSSGGQRVGWLDRQGKFTDITALTTSGRSDFAAAPQHSNPLFTPDGMFFFADAKAGTYSILDPETKTIIKDSEKLDTKLPLVFGPNGSMTELSSECWALPDEAGALNSFSSAPRRASLVDIIGNTGLYRVEEETSFSRLFAYSKASAGCSGGFDDSGWSPLTPESDWKIMGAAASGDRIAFKAYRGTTGNSEDALFVTSTEPGVEPTKVADLGTPSMTGMRLLFWR